MSSNNDVQLDLFGDVAASEERRQRIADEQQAWRERFDRAEWRSPMPNIAPKLGYRCPDPDCHEVEPNTFLLSINHGFDPDIPGHEPFNGRCHKIRRAGGGSP